MHINYVHEKNLILSMKYLIACRLNTKPVESSEHEIKPLQSSKLEIFDSVLPEIKPIESLWR